MAEVTTTTNKRGTIVANVKPDGGGGPKKEPRWHLAGDEGSEVKVSASAQKLADENGIDLATVTGSGADGRIVKEDVEAAIAAQNQDNG